MRWRMWSRMLGICGWLSLFLFLGFLSPVDRVEVPLLFVGYLLGVWWVPVGLPSGVAAFNDFLPSHQTSRPQHCSQTPRLCHVHFRQDRQYFHFRSNIIVRSRSGRGRIVHRYRRRRGTCLPRNRSWSVSFPDSWDVVCAVVVVDGWRDDALVGCCGRRDGGEVAVGPFPPVEGHGCPGEHGDGDQSEGPCRDDSRLPRLNQEPASKISRRVAAV